MDDGEENSVANRLEKRRRRQLARDATRPSLAEAIRSKRDPEDNGDSPPMDNALAEQLLEDSGGQRNNAPSPARAASRERQQGYPARVQRRERQQSNSPLMDRRDRQEENPARAERRGRQRSDSPQAGRRDRGYRTPPPKPVLELESGGYPREMDDDWQKGKSLKQCNQYMLSGEIACDVTFVVGDNQEEIRAHRYVLMCRNAKFFKSLSQRKHERDIAISVPNVKPDIFRLLLTYIYTDEVDQLSVAMALDLLDPAALFDMADLQTLCFQYLASEMYSENVCQIMEKMHLFNETNLQKQCLRFIHVNAEDVLKSPHVKKLCRSCLKTVLTSDELRADERMVYGAAVSWADAECARRRLEPSDRGRREVLGEVLFAVRFPIMNVDVFTQKVSQDEILNPEEKIALFQFFHGETSRLPSRFNLKDRKQYVEDTRFSRPLPAIASSNSMAVVKYQSPKFPDSMDLKGRRTKRVMRFKGAAGQWQMNGPDAIMFRCSVNIMLHGIQVFGPSQGADRYDVIMNVLDDTKKLLGNKITRLQTNGEDRLYQLNLSQPISIPAITPVTVLVHMKGKPTIRGTDGLTDVTVDDIHFEFSNSNLSVNGTDITTGQIPALLFSV